MMWYSCILVPLSFVLLAAINEILPTIMYILEHIPIVKGFIKKENQGEKIEVASTNSNIRDQSNNDFRKELKVE